jgi:hypothetical protein
VCAFIDAEHALDVNYAKKLGVKTEELLVSQPDCGEQALEIADMLVRSNAIDVIVIDSVAALTPKAELEGEMGDAHVGLQARLMSQALRKLTGAISRSRTMVVFINQIRMKIGVMFGSPETTTGGNALKFYASCRLDIRRIGALKKEEDVIGNRTRVKVVKNKIRHPLRPGYLARRRPRRPRERGEHRRQERRVVLVQRGAHRPGSREREAVPRRAPRGLQRDRGQGPRALRRPADRDRCRLRSSVLAGRGVCRRQEAHGPDARVTVFGFLVVLVGLVVVLGGEWSDGGG